MIKRRIFKRLAAMVAAILLAGSAFFGAGVALANAATAPTKPGMPPYGPLRETAKVTLPQTSIDGPAFWTLRGPSSPQGPLVVLAWTGTDQRIRFMSGNDGLHYSGQRTLNETSFVRPAVVRGLAGVIALAWTGTDPGHHLNVLYGAQGATPMKLTLWRDMSFTSPNLEWLSTDPRMLLLTWAGTDANHSLNVLQISVTDHGLVAGTKTILWRFHSLAQPELRADASRPNPRRFFLGWSDLTSHRITWATSSDSKTWTQQPTFPEWTCSAPSMIGINGIGGIGLPPYWLTWTGTDSLRHVNMSYAVYAESWAKGYVKTTLPETAIGGAVAGYFPTGTGTQLLLAWTGTDPSHHLNVALIGV